MEDLAKKVTENALKLGAQYADLRIEQSRGEGFLLENGSVEQIISGSSVGAGIRVLAEKALGAFMRPQGWKEKACLTQLNEHIKWQSVLLDA